MGKLEVIHKFMKTNLFVERLTVIDFSYLDRHRGLVGESWIMDVELEGSLDEQGMVFDFSHVKKNIKQWIDQFIDHKLVVPLGRKEKSLVENQTLNAFDFLLDSGERIYHSSPTDAVLFLENIDFVTPDNVEQILSKALLEILPENVSKVHLTLRAEETEDAFYHYSHGLQKHDGNCQRIAHGHRSPVIIEVDAIRNKDLEQLWATRWQDIYLATASHQVKSSKEGYLRFEYLSRQGRFELELPERFCYILETETTVEHLAAFLAKTISLEVGKPCRVRAFEGVGKGAIVEFR